MKSDGGRGAVGTGRRIATASVRTGFAMTHYKECGASPVRAVGDAGPYGLFTDRISWGAASPTPRAWVAVDRKGRPYEISCRGGRPCPPVGVSGVRYAAGGGQPTLHYIMFLCGAWGRGCKRPFPRQQGGGAPHPVGGIFVSYLFRLSKLSAVTMDWTLVHRGAKVLARSS